MNTYPAIESFGPDSRYATGGLTFREAMRIAIGHATPIVEDDEADASDGHDTEVTTEHLALAGKAVEATGPITEAELLALADVVAVGAEYMDVNEYADDDDFPEDVAAANQLGSGTSAWHFVVEVLYGLKPTYRVAGQPQVYTDEFEARKVAEQGASELRPPRIERYYGSRHLGSTNAGRRGYVGWAWAISTERWMA